MGVKNFLIEGVTCAGKTTVAKALRHRGFHTLNSDVDLAYKGNPDTGERLERPTFQNDAERVIWVHQHQIWDVDKVRSIVKNHKHPVSFFCGGSRNFHHFIALFDGIFILDLDQQTLRQRLSKRVDEWGSHPIERDLVLKLHQSQESIPQTGTRIDATRPVDEVVDKILSHIGETR